MPSIWKGFLTFGLVNVPVELRPAVREDHIKFRLLHKPDLSPVRYQRVCERDGKPVEWNDIVKGYEFETDQFVVLTEDDFKSVSLRSSKSLDILDFVKQDEIDPRYFDTPYYLVPARGGEKPYALLREAIRETGCVGIGKITIRQSQHLAGVKAVGKALVLEMMRFAGEVIEPAAGDFPEAAGIRKAEMDLARQLVESLRAPFAPDIYKDDYREGLMKIIAGKMKGEKVEIKEPAPEGGGQIINLMEKLRESLRKAPARREPKAADKPAEPRGRASARRSRQKTA